MPLLVPVSVGELLDKISILELKDAAISDPAKRANVVRELELLRTVRRSEVAASPALDALYAELSAVNGRLWDIEDRIRDCERDARFDAGFVALARSVYRENDHRALLKRQINELAGSDIVEEKTYV